MADSVQTESFASRPIAMRLAPLLAGLLGAVVALVAANLRGFPLPLDIAGVFATIGLAASWIARRNPFQGAAFVALLAAVAIGAAGVLGLYPMVYASFIAMLVGPVIHVVISVATRGQYYFKTFPQDMKTDWRPTDAYSGPKPALTQEAE